MRAVITVIGKDTTGIIAAVSNVLKEREINILDNYKDYNKKVLLNNYDNESNILKPYQSVLYLLTKE